MQYIITFLEGFISFISPCMLPMLPIYISYFAGHADKKHKTLFKVFGFILGFTLVFTALGLFAGTIGGLLTKYQNIVNIVSGAIVILFGLSYIEIIRLPFFKGMKGDKKEVSGFFSSMLFGVIYSISLTPCVGAFLGSALMLASSTGGALKGTLLLLTYSLGLGVPFFISAILIDKLNTIFGFIKRHYKVINNICGIFLIIIGILMMCGLLNAFLAILS